MSDLLRTGLGWLAGQLRSHAATEVTYTRGGGSAAIRATFGRKLLRLDDGEGGIRMEWTDLDLLVRASDLVLDGNPIEPRRGDRVEVVEADEGLTLIYEVGAIPGEPPWTWSDPHRRMLRIRCRFVDSEPYS